ncbi:MAG TPA: hypothetical protein VE422_18835 [Terriglobia bacterium]|nr:hypothetical protein [Terriglobia bacterium]
MRSAARLAEAARDISVSIEHQLQAQYDYAVFLANNSDAIFFNDSIWNGIQTWTFQIESGQVDALGGAVTFRLLQGHAPLTTKFTNALITLLLAGCSTKESR